MLTKILKNLILITVLIQFSLLEPSQQHEGLYFEDNFDEATLFDGNYFVIGARFVNFFNALDYKPNPLTDETLTLTDITSITSQTVDNETCVIPFEYNDVLNYFCVPNTPEDTLLCGDSSGNFSECAFGQLMAVRPARGINAFSTQFQFADPFQFKSNLFYTFEFNYLLNYDVCDNDSLQLEIALYDRDSTKQVLFDLSTNEYPNENNRWNTFSTCFHGLDDDFYLMITASNICDNSMVFVALDNIIVRQTNGDHLEETCQNFRVTSENHAESTISSLELTTSKESIYPTEEIVTSTSKSETTSKSNIESTLLVDLTSKIWTSDLPTSASTSTSSSTHSATPEITTTTATTTKTTSTITEEESNETDLLFIVTIISGVSLVLVVVLFVVVFIFGCCIIKKLNYKKVSPTRNFEMS